MNNYFSDNLKYLRELKGWSQSELARRTVKTCEKYNLQDDGQNKIKPITQGAIARWEANENSPSIDNIVVLARTFDVSLPDLIGKDLKSSNVRRKIEFTESEKKEALKQVLKEKGFLNESEEISQEDFDRLIEFAKRNKDFIVDKKE